MKCIILIGMFTSLAHARWGLWGTLTKTIKCHVFGFFVLCFRSVLLVSVHKVVNGVASCWGLHKRSTLRTYKRKPLHVGMLVKAGSEVPRHPAPALVLIVTRLSWMFCLGGLDVACLCTPRIAATDKGGR
jgi:hypothetical protein